jgi:hypothetical protein
VPIVVGDAVNLYRKRIAGSYLSMTMSPYAWDVRKRKKNGRITKIGPNR